MVTFEPFDAPGTPKSERGPRTLGAPGPRLAPEATGSPPKQSRADGRHRAAWLRNPPGVAGVQAVSGQPLMLEAVPMGAVMALVSRTRSAGASSMSSPRRPPDTRRVAKSKADSSRTVGGGLPLSQRRYASQHISGAPFGGLGIGHCCLLGSEAAATDFRSRFPDTGTMATARRPSTSTMRVLKTRSGSMPRTSEAPCRNWPPTDRAHRGGATRRERRPLQVLQ